MVEKISSGSQMADVCLPFEKQTNTNEGLSPPKRQTAIALTAFF